MSKRVRPQEEIDTDELIRVWMEKSNITMAQARTLYAILMDCMVDHLCVEFKSVDMGFCAIHPSLYRKNWPQYVWQRFPFLGQWIRGKSAAERERIINEAGVKHDLSDCSMLACRNGLVYVGLEVVPKKSWFRYSLYAQRKLLSSAGPVGYARLVGRIVHRLKDRMLETYRLYLAQVSLPNAKLASGRYYGGASFLAERRDNKKIRASAIPVRLSPLVVNRDPSELQSSGAAEDLASANAYLPEVRALQPPAQDLRDGGGQSKEE